MADAFNNAAIALIVGADPNASISPTIEADAAAALSLAGIYLLPV